jgi:hypothetical protein
MNKVLTVTNCAKRTLHGLSLWQAETWRIKNIKEPKSDTGQVLCVCTRTTYLKDSLQRHCTEYLKQIIPEMKLRDLVPNSYIGGPMMGIYKSLTDTYMYMNVEIGIEAARFHFREYINWILFAVWMVYVDLLLTLYTLTPPQLQNNANIPIYSLKIICFYTHREKMSFWVDIFLPSSLSL